MKLQFCVSKVNHLFVRGKPWVIMGLVEQNKLLKIFRMTKKINANQLKFSIIISSVDPMPHIITN